MLICSTLSARDAKSLICHRQPDASPNFSNLQFTLGRESSRIGAIGLRGTPSSGWRRYPEQFVVAVGRSNGVIGSVTRRLTMMSLPFLLFACGLGAAWTSRREVAMGFWVAGVLVLLALFRFHATDVLNLGL